MLLEELEKLKTEGQPQTLDELFNQSKEGMMSDRVIGNVNNLLPQMKERMMNEMKTIIAKEVKNQAGMIKVRDGRDGQSGRPGIDGTDGADGKDAIINKDEIISEIMKKIPPVSVSRQKGGGGSTMKIENLSSQCNGVNTIFSTLNRVGSNNVLFYSSFPSVIVPNTDYSISGNRIAITTFIPDAGQTLVIIYDDAT